MKDKIPYNTIARYITGNCSPNEAEFVTSWIEESDENQKCFNELYEIWENTGSLKFEKSFDAETALNEVDRIIESGETWQKDKKFINLSGLRIAASVIIIAGLSYMFYLLSGVYGEKEVIFETGAEKSRIELSDGSIVWLNKNSKLTYPETFQENERLVKLSGEAFFEIERDTNRPFIINTSDASVKVLGTSFSIETNDRAKTTIVRVATGLVEFKVKSSKKESVFLKKGEMATFEKEAKVLNKEIMQNENAFAWKTGKLIFRNKPFQEAVNEISKYYQKKMVISDSSVNDQPFNGYFENQSFEEVVDVLKLNRNIEIKDSSGIIFITKK